MTTTAEPRRAAHSRNWNKGLQGKAGDQSMWIEHNRGLTKTLARSKRAVAKDAVLRLSPHRVHLLVAVEEHAVDLGAVVEQQLEGHLSVPDNGVFQRREAYAISVVADVEQRAEPASDKTKRSSSGSAYEAMRCITVNDPFSVISLVKPRVMRSFIASICRLWTGASQGLLLSR
ncbi:hypothetical protein B0T26DRAFT_675909 [Lasiosphaeria miniovina]|uniref:Uncharacterized protein n=1 Tax=Lasiosphaeria miniovina TaxID=1954250 RepID=A0AA40DZY0_9PEZI|nr:uncharacterized protein B0T26DRAFT_675909 [Lasiosphaeria miniovina]KAK0717633.1 hypothetical protein B0T26DRAFT_675909 [Lasiosphaeria miniovina]